MNTNPDFRTRLQEIYRDSTRRTFRPIRAGPYWLSLQPSGGFLPHPTQTIAVEDYDRWEVTVHKADGACVTPLTHPQLFHDELWRRYWLLHRSERLWVGQQIPTEVVQTLYDFLVLGPDHYNCAMAVGQQ